MAEQSDQANVSKTGTAGAVGARPAPRTLDQSRMQGNQPPQARSADQIARDRDAAQHGIDPSTGEPRRNPAPNPANPGSHLDPTAPNAKQQSADAEQSAARDRNVTTNVVDPEKTAAIQDKVAADRNAHNEEGHALNMKRIEEQSKAAHENKPRNQHLGKQRDVNTPVIDPKTGAKSWPL